MVRYEIREGKILRYWEAVVVGKTFTTTTGRVGDRRKRVEKVEWSDPKTAKTELARLVEKKKRAGWTLVAETEDASAPARRGASGGGETLEEAIRADPDDAAAWLVYADFLQSKGDPRGELVVVQEARSRKPRDRALRDAEDTLFDEHADAFLGELVAHLEDRESGEPALALEWKNGFVASAILRDHDWYDVGAEDDDERLRETQRVRGMLGDLLDHPSGAFLTSLTIVSTGDLAYQAVVDLLASRERPPPLRTLVLGSFERPCTIAEVGALLAAYPKLRVLHVGATVARPFAIDGLDLVDLRVAGVAPEVVEAIGRAKRPTLEALDLGVGDVPASAFDALFAKGALPKLRHLGLRGATRGDEILTRLARSPLLSQIAVLDLSGGRITGRGVRALVAKKKSSRLERIDLRRNRLDDDARMALDGIAKEIVDADQLA